jgi:hypothetical protein
MLLALRIAEVRQALANAYGDRKAMAIFDRRDSAQPE